MEAKYLRLKSTCKKGWKLFSTWIERFPSSDPRSWADAASRGTKIRQEDRRGRLILRRWCSLSAHLEVCRWADQRRRWRSSPRSWLVACRRPSGTSPPCSAPSRCGRPCWPWCTPICNSKYEQIMPLTKPYSHVLEYQLTRSCNATRLRSVTLVVRVPAGL